MVGVAFAYGIGMFAGFMATLDHSGRGEQGRLGFYYRNRVVLTAFWPVALGLLALDAFQDWRREHLRKEALEMQKVRLDLEKARRAVEKELEKEFF